MQKESQHYKISYGVFVISLKKQFFFVMQFFQRLDNSSFQYGLVFRSLLRVFFLDPHCNLMKYKKNNI